jgi:non-heme Fe2+,alpha-ketoglutarate-dependent halogenase
MELEKLRAKYHKDGIIYSITALNESEIVEAQRQYLKMCAPGKMILEGRQRLFGHLVHPWITTLVSHHTILEKVSALIGPNILVWVSEFNAKAPKTPHYFSWHQDLYYWGHKSDEDFIDMPMVTVWLSLFNATPLNGCMRVIPGSHTHLIDHKENPNDHNMLTRSQELEVKVDEQKAVDVTLSAGEFSIHHPLIHHSSGPNISSECRVGLVIRYLSPKIAPPIRPAYAWLVSGEDVNVSWDHVAPINFPSGSAGQELFNKSIKAIESCTKTRFK